MGLCHCCQLQRDREATPLPVMYESKYHGHSKISMNGLCSVRTTHLCDTTIRCLDSLAAYHHFVDTHCNTPRHSSDSDSTAEATNTTTTSNGATSSPPSIIQLILKRRNVDEYSPEMLREDYHHFATYHVSNRRYLKQCYERLMNMNEEQDIIDLFDITDRINADKKEGLYFGLQMEDEKAMIDVLNEMHQDLDHDIDDDDDLDHDIHDFNDHQYDDEDSLGPLDLIKKLRIEGGHYRMAGTHLQHQESLELGSLTPVGYASHDGRLILPEDEERMIALVNEEEEVFPETVTPSMFDANYSVDGY